MNYYKYKQNYLFSLRDGYSFEKIKEIPQECKELYFLTELKNKSKGSFCVSQKQDLFWEKESLDMLKINDIETDLHVPQQIIDLIDERKVKLVNTSFQDYKDHLLFNYKKTFKVNIMALGDVGSTLLIGLKLLGGGTIDTIGIYDRSEEKKQRWEYEMNQSSYPFEDKSPTIKKIEKEELFDCDMFIFCASKGVPPVGKENVDVRMVQLEENANLIKEYAIQAANSKFKGIFAVVSDPVDPLCSVVLKESKGALVPEQIKGYGLGVMNARARYYAKKDERFSSFLNEGRAFGPHGKGLVIANSIDNYDKDLSVELTNLAETANLEVRKTGFKPFVAPALSSGAISIILTLKGEWHYSSNYLSGIYLGAKNRNLPSGLEIEKINMPSILFDIIQKTYELQQSIVARLNW